MGGIVGDIGLLATAGEAESIPEGIVLMASGADGLDAKTPYDAARAVAVGEAGSHLHRVSKAVIRYSVVLASTVYESVPSYWLAVLMVSGVVVAFLLCWCARMHPTCRRELLPFASLLLHHHHHHQHPLPSHVRLSAVCTAPCLPPYSGRAPTASAWWGRSAALSTRRKSEKGPLDDTAPYVEQPCCSSCSPALVRCSATGGRWHGGGERARTPIRTTCALSSARAHICVA